MTMHCPFRNGKCRACGADIDAVGRLLGLAPRVQALASPALARRRIAEIIGRRPDHEATIRIIKTGELPTAIAMNALARDALHIATQLRTLGRRRPPTGTTNPADAVCDDAEELCVPAFVALGEVARRMDDPQLDTALFWEVHSFLTAPMIETGGLTILFLIDAMLYDAIFGAPTSPFETRRSESAARRWPAGAAVPVQ